MQKQPFIIGNQTEPNLMMHTQNNEEASWNYLQCQQRTMPPMQNTSAPFIKQELEKQSVLFRSQVRVNERSTIEVMKSNASIARKLLRMNVMLDRDGRVNIVHETFGENKVVPLNYTIVENVCFVTNNGNDKGGILHSIFNSSNEKNREIWVDTQNIESFNKKMIQAGICFGFKPALEKAIRQLLLLTLIEFATIQEIPSHHGWKKRGEESIYVFPEELTWSEVLKYV